ncbi:MAG: ABC transporter ATP-binding protein [Alphaproteobacteria bacterium]
MKLPFSSFEKPLNKSFITVESLNKNFGATQAVHSVSFEIDQGEFFAFLGPSGCGKTTLLRLLAGFENPTTGRVIIDNVDITNCPPYQRPVNMMFQSYALFPHMSVYQNVAFGLRQEKLPQKVIHERVCEGLELVQMTGYINSDTQRLSGGQCQRVALARILVKRPKLLLLDEPLAALDRRLREQTQMELVRIQKQVGITFIMVTHDQEEAMSMATRLAVMKDGTIEQIGTAYDLYEFPNSKYVANFLGNNNFFYGTVVEDEVDHIVVQTEDSDLLLYITHAATIPLGTEVTIAIRPEKVTLSSTPSRAKTNCLKGKVKNITYRGAHSIYDIQSSSGEVIKASVPNRLRLSELGISSNEDIFASWCSESGVVLVR